MLPIVESCPNRHSRHRLDLLGFFQGKETVSLLPHLLYQLEKCLQIQVCPKFLHDRICPALFCFRRQFPDGHSISSTELLKIMHIAPTPGNPPL